MDTLYRKFFHNFYLRTGGFMPFMPLDQSIFPGDFFQVRNGEIIVLGNIFRKGIIDRHDCELSAGIKLNQSGWTFSDGVTKPYSGRGQGHWPNVDDFEYSKQVLTFNSAGSFFFKANEPESVKINNWSLIQQQLIVKLTQTFYSFREVYVVTESATTADWTLAVASSNRGELEISTDTGNFGLVDIFGHHWAKTIQSKDIEYYHREANRKPNFFKAQKLVVQEERTEVFVSDLIDDRLNQSEWARSFYNYDFYYDNDATPRLTNNAQASLLDMLQANELNANTALLYFKWADVTLDDVEKLFSGY